MPQIIIVGAGLAGLASALSLRRAGHKVQVFEASQLGFRDTEGTIAQIGPKVNDILKRWGVDAAVARPVLIKAVSEFDHDGAPGATEEAPKPPGWCYYQRSRLHEALLNSATAPTGSGHPVEIISGMKISAIDPEAGLVISQEGQAYHGDAIIGADGWHSISRKTLPLNDTTIPAPAKVTIHLNVDISGHEQNQIVQRFRLQPERYEKWCGANIELKLYSVEPGTILVDTVLPVGSTSGKSSYMFGYTNLAELDICEEYLKDELLKVFGSANSPLKELLDAAEYRDIQFWFYPNLPHVQEWAFRRLVLIGDAAHPFLPCEPPGTSQSITGADALAEALRSDVEMDHIPEHLAAWVIPRKERVKTIQGMERNDWPST
ncbi:hypothetical protein BDV30DRAFT_245969 [Aspergillus minisclerotigenes]|uniref:FAD-binding domain-containing protein n=1 Tax=Aspergillus minisclerotigenes TaxID=656917 RepID=A0A5N6IQF8_9EURO|nr:hypothetical protein BDV30DRAFT_245969 [Aspergillus minisclerotigenes]